MATCEFWTAPWQAPLTDEALAALSEVPVIEPCGECHTCERFLDVFYMLQETPQEYNDL